MGVDVHVRLFPQGPVHAPYEVGQAKTDEEPGRQAPSKGLHPLEFRHRDAQADAQEAEDDRAQDVSQSAEERDDKGFRKGPSPRPGHNNEREVVVGPDDGVDEADRGRRPGQNPNLVRHAPIIPEIKDLVDGRRLELPTSALRTPRSPS